MDKNECSISANDSDQRKIAESPSLEVIIDKIEK